MAKKQTVQELRKENQFLMDWIERIRKPIVEASNAAGLCSSIQLGNGGTVIGVSKPKHGDGMILGLWPGDRQRAVGEVGNTPEIGTPILQIVVGNLEAANVLRGAIELICTALDKKNSCSHCGEKFAELSDGLIPTHDFPKLCRSVCPGSGLAPQNEQPSNAKEQ